MSVTFEDEQTVSYRARPKKSGLFTLVQKLSGGLIQTDKQASIFLLLFCAALIAIAIYLFNSSGSNATNLSDQQINQIINNQQDR